MRIPQQKTGDERADFRHAWQEGGDAVQAAIAAVFGLCLFALP